MKCVRYDFKFGTQLGFAKAHYKITPRAKWAWPWVRELPKILGFPYNISATALANDFKAPKYLGFPFNISATAALSS